MTEWNKLQDIEASLKAATLPKEPINLYSGVFVVDHVKFATTHLKVCHANAGKNTFLPYLERLKIYVNKITP
jgi:hypothetical protein